MWAGRDVVVVDVEAVDVLDEEVTVTVVVGSVVVEGAAAVVEEVLGASVTTAVEGSVRAAEGQRIATMTMTPTATTSMVAVTAKRSLRARSGRLPVPSVSNPCPLPPRCRPS